MTLPAKDDLASVGGAINDYRPVPDPTVERSAAFDNTIAADVVAATWTITRAFAAFVAGASPALSSHDAVWGTGAGVAPVVAKTATGVFTVTWPATVNDVLGVSQSVNLRRAWPSLEGTTPGFATATVTSPNVVTVRTFNSSGVANDLTGTIIVVFAV